MICKVAIEKVNYENDIEYSYLVPCRFSSIIQIGQRVIVPFGKGNNLRQGLVIEIIKEERNLENLKTILEIVDSTPIISQEMISIIFWMKSHYFCSYFEAFRLASPQETSEEVTDLCYELPSDIDLETILEPKKKFLHKLISAAGHEFSYSQMKNLKLPNYLEFLNLLLEEKVILQKLKISTPAQKREQKFFRLCENKEEVKISDKQKLVLNFLKNHTKASMKDICSFTKVSSSVVNSLLKKNLIQEALETTSIAQPLCVETQGELSNEQNKAYKDILKEYNSPQPRPVLLHGVTGSGKTQVILSLIDYVLNQGKSAIFLVPEIALTLQFIKIFTSKYKEKIAVIHSGISSSQKAETWRKIKNGDIKIVVGARSAIFAPFENLGLIAVDEEHEFTYKSEFSPKFDAREVARYRCKYNKCILIFSSATPLVETYYMAKQGKYLLCTLKNRYGNLKLPDVKIIDMNGKFNYEGQVLFSEEILSEIKKEISLGNQAVLLINRRGFNTLVKCMNCGQIQTCPYCSVSLNYHKKGNLLLCHYCGYSKTYTEECEFCKEHNLVYLGFGTQKAEDQLAEFFPTAKIARLDSDTKTSDEKDIIKKFEDGQYDILIGTQMISKGFNFPKVTFVGILIIDQYLFGSDFKSTEKAFALITQTVGRAGRKHSQGKAFIQTFVPENNILQLAAKQDYEKFFNEEIAMRKLMLNPPFSDICVVLFKGKQEKTVYSCCVNFFNNLKAIAKEKYSDIPLMIFNPSPAEIQKIAGNYRYKVVMKCRNTKKFHRMINELVLDKKFKSCLKKVSISIDFNPATIL